MVSTRPTSPTAGPYRVHYYPNTENLRPHEIRVTALGTGNPYVRKSQASPAWLMEVPVAPHEKPARFLFDLGTGSMANFAVLQIPFEDARNVFLSHLHSDHWGDFWAYWIGGRVQGRASEIKVWGPSGETPELGSEAALNHAMAAMKWDVESRVAAGQPEDPKAVIREFPYDEPTVLYQQDGILIKSFEADHALPGAVSFSLEWNGIKIVYGGDTRIEPELSLRDAYESQCKGADLFIHECFVSSTYHYDTNGAPTYEIPESQGGNVHTSPSEFGERMARVRPKHAVAFHFYNDFDTGLQVYNQIRENYDGPLTLAKDLMVWNVTKERTIVRNVAYHPDGWINGIYEQPPERE